MPAILSPFGESAALALVNAKVPKTTATAPIIIDDVPTQGIIENNKAKIPITKLAMAKPCPLFC
jgi:hypothetical protein